MRKTINLNEFRKRERSKVEAEARDKHGVVKVNDDLFLFPESSFTTYSFEVDSLFEVLGMGITDLFEDSVIEQINSLVDCQNQKIAIMVAEVEGDMVTFEIFNMSNNRRFLLGTVVKNTYESRRIFAGLVAGAIKKVNVDVTFLLKLNYKEVESMVK